MFHLFILTIKNQTSIFLTKDLLIINSVTLDSISLSELFIISLEKLLKKCNVNIDNIKSIIFSEELRNLTSSKIISTSLMPICLLKKINLYLISSFDILSMNEKELNNFSLYILTLKEDEFFIRNNANQEILFLRKEELIKYISQYKITKITSDKEVDIKEIKINISIEDISIYKMIKCFEKKQTKLINLKKREIIKLHFIRDAI